MITFEWHLLIYILINAVIFCWAITRDGEEGFLGSEKMWAFFGFIITLVFSTSIYGGIFWW